MKQTIDWASDQVIDVLIVGYGPVGAALAALLLDVSCFPWSETTLLGVPLMETK